MSAIAYKPSHSNSLIATAYNQGQEDALSKLAGFSDKTVIDAILNRFMKEGWGTSSVSREVIASRLANFKKELESVASRPVSKDISHRMLVENVANTLPRSDSLRNSFFYRNPNPGKRLEDYMKTWVNPADMEGKQAIMDTVEANLLKNR